MQPSAPGLSLRGKSVAQRDLPLVEICESFGYKLQCEEIGPYYSVIGTNPPANYTDARGTFKLVRIPSAFLEEIGEHLGSDFVRRNFGTETEEEHNAA